MKRLICRKCGGSFFKFKQDDSSVQCFKCKNPIAINNLGEERMDKVEYISTSWESVAK